jgi:hypothetical protein
VDSNYVAEKKCSIGELVKSFASFSWATVLFGVSQMGNVFWRDSLVPTSRATDAASRVTCAVESQLNEGKMIFQTGDQIPSKVADVISGMLTPESFTPRGMMKTALDVVQVMAEAPRRLMPEEQSRLAWQEFQNKLEAFSLFEHVDLVLDLPPARHMTLAELTARASSLGTYRSVWAVEGVGHYYAQCMGAGGRDQRVWQTDRSSTWPTERLSALHAGMGLSFASAALKQVTPRKSSVELKEKLQEFFALCRDNSHEGYVGAAYEALGLVARNLYPHLVPSIDGELAEMDQRLVGYFWHGVGRAIYFAPSNFLPAYSAPWRAMEMVRSEPPHELGRVNALAGLIWSLALVNLRHPEILEIFLKYHHPQVGDGDVFANSLSSALVIWRDSSADDTLIQKLCSHRPANPALTELWERWVSRPCANASRRHYLILKENNGLGRLFRHQSFPEMIAEMEVRQSVFTR